jgi:hypothetical protein
VQAPAAAPSTAPAGRTEARGDVLFELNGTLRVGDVSVIHPGASSFRRAAANSAGAAAALRDEQKRRQYRLQGSTGYLFVPLTLETYGRLGKPLMSLLGDVGQLAADRGQGLFTKQQFVQGVLRELSVCLCRYNAMLERGVAGFFVKASGFAIKHGLTRPTADVSDSD